MVLPVPWFLFQGSGNTRLGRALEESEVLVLIGELHCRGERNTIALVTLSECARQGSPHHVGVVHLEGDLMHPPPIGLAFVDLEDDPLDLLPSLDEGGGAGLFFSPLGLTLGTLKAATVELDEQAPLLERELATLAESRDDVPRDVVGLAAPRPLNHGGQTRAVFRQLVEALACVQALLEALHVERGETTQAMDVVSTLAANEQATVAGLVDSLAGVEQVLSAYLTTETLPALVPDVLRPDGIVPKFGVQDVHLDGRAFLGIVTGLDVDVGDDNEVLAGEGLCLRWCNCR